MALITISWLLDGTILILTAFIMAFYLYMTRNFNYWKKRNIQEISPTPIFGNVTDCLFQKKNLGQLVKVFYDESQGLPYIGLYLFDKPALMIRDIDLLKEIFIKDFDYFSDHCALADKKHDLVGYSNLFFLKNPTWRVIRTKLSPFFTSFKLKKMFHLIMEVGEDMDTYLASLKLDGEGQIVDVKDIASRYTIDMIGSIAYGIKVNSLNKPDCAFRKYGRRIFDYDIIRGFTLMAAFCIPEILSLARLKIFRTTSTSFFRNVFWQVINYRLESKEKRNDLIDILIELKKTRGNDEIDGFKFDGDDLLAQAVFFFTDGFETTSTTIAFVLYELAIHPEIQNRARKEIMNAIKASNGEITYDMVQSLSYLDMVIFETLRFYPSLTFLDRVVTKNYKIPNSDLIIEKGTPIFISVLGMHLDPEYFPDPLTFDPERFNDKNTRNRPSMVYLPFGEGPRECIGSRMGLLQVKLALVKFLTYCEVIPCEKTLIPMVINPKGLVMSPLDDTMYLNIRKF